MQHRNTDSFINKLGCRIHELSRIEVKLDSNLNLSNVEIRKDNKVVFKDGQQHNRIGQAYGRQTFVVFYDGKEIAQVEHFKKNNWYTYDYNFHISEKGEEIVVKLEVERPN